MHRMQWLNVVMGEGRPFSAVQQVGQNVLHQKAPHKWDVTNVSLHTVAKGDNVAKVQLVPQLLYGPLVFRIFGHAFLQEEPSHAQTGNVPQDVSNKADPDGLAIGVVETKPKSTALDETSKTST
jgi:hypothetical protein